MKKPLLIVVLLVVLAGVLAYAFMPNGGVEQKSDYLRIHIRANSDSQKDQEVKFLVRDAVINFLIPLLAKSGDYFEAKQILQKNLNEIELETEKVLRQNGFYYGCKASLVKEEFPLRAYNDLTLPKGVYDALILNLGGGEGANWWCVAFPPLCFIPAENSAQVKYKSKILEIIKRFS